MFTGIIEGPALCQEAVKAGTGLQLWIAPPRLGEGREPWKVALGDSIAVCGACLTVAGFREPGGGALLEPGGEPRPEHEMLFDLTLETVQRTWFGALEPGMTVNLERAMRLGDRLDGHMVSGHVDGGGRLVERREMGDGGQVLTIELDRAEEGSGLERYLIEKGSICLDGVSLTVVEPRGRTFDVALIPLTLDWTNLATKAIGSAFNVEADQVGKWIERLLPPLPGR